MYPRYIRALFWVLLLAFGSRIWLEDKIFLHLCDLVVWSHDRPQAQALQPAAHKATSLLRAPLMSFSGTNAPLQLQPACPVLTHRHFCYGWLGIFIVFAHLSHIGHHIDAGRSFSLAVSLRSSCRTTSNPVIRLSH